MTNDTAVSAKNGSVTFQSGDLMTFKAVETYDTKAAVRVVVHGSPSAQTVLYGSVEDGIFTAILDGHKHEIPASLIRNL